MTHWNRAREWIAERPADLQLEERIETEAARWAQAKDRDKKSLLRAPGLPLTEAEDLLARQPDELAQTAHAFIAASGQRARLRRHLTLAAGFLVLSPLLVSCLAYSLTQALLAERTTMSSELPTTWCLI